VKVASLGIFIKFYSKLYTSIKALIVKLARMVDYSETGKLGGFFIVILMCHKQIVIFG
jgi:hypothetical protein